MDIQSQPDLEQLCVRLDYSFGDPSLLLQAVRHSSYIHEHPELAGESYERLEFLGDAVLELVITELLYRRFPEAAEGQLSKARAGVVNENRLANVARSLGVGPCLLLGRGEELQGGREKPSILADVVEALAAAIYLDGGLEEARRVLSALLGEAAENALLRTPKKAHHPGLLQDPPAGGGAGVPAHHPGLRAHPHRGPGPRQDLHREPGHRRPPGGHRQRPLQEGGRAGRRPRRGLEAWRASWSGASPPAAPAALGPRRSFVYAKGLGHLPHALAFLRNPLHNQGSTINRGPGILMVVVHGNLQSKDS